AGAGRYVTFVNKDKLPFFVGVLLFALPPSGGVGDFRQDQSRLDRIEHFPGVKNLKQRISAAVVDVDEIFARAPLRRDPLCEIGAGTGNVSYLDLGISLLKDSGVDNCTITTNSDGDLPLLLGRTHRLFPLTLPCGFRICSENGPTRTYERAQH